MSRAPDRLTGIFATAANAVWGRNSRRRQAFESVSERFGESFKELGGQARISAEDALEPSEGAVWRHTTPEELDELLEQSKTPEIFFRAAGEDADQAIGILKEEALAREQHDEQAHVERSPAPGDDVLPSEETETPDTAYEEDTDIARGSEDPIGRRRTRPRRRSIPLSLASERAADQARKGASWSGAVQRAAEASIGEESVSEIASDEVRAEEGVNLESFHYRLSAMTSLAEADDNAGERMKELRGMSTRDIAGEVRQAESTGQLKTGQVYRRAEQWTEAAKQKVTSLDRTGALQKARIDEYKETAGFELDPEKYDLEGTELAAASGARRRGMSEEAAGRVGQAAAFRSLFGGRYGLDTEQPGTEQSLYKDTRRAALMEINAGAVTGRERSRRLGAMREMTDTQLQGRAQSMGYTQDNVSRVQKRLLSVAGSVAEREEADEDLRERVSAWKEEASTAESAADKASVFKQVGLDVDMSSITSDLQESRATLIKESRARGANPPPSTETVNQALTVSASMETPESPRRPQQGELVPVPGGFIRKDQVQGRDFTGEPRSGGEPFSGRGEPAREAPDASERPQELRRRLDTLEQEINAVKETVNSIARGLDRIFPEDAGAYHEGRT